MIQEQIDQMPAGKELDVLIEKEIYQAIPLTDDEWQLLRTAWQMTSPGWLNSYRPMKVPTKEPDPETGAMYRLGFPQDFSTNDQGAAGLVHRMRRDGWRFTLIEDEDGTRVVSFSRKGLGALSRAETDALAISRAALKAKILEVQADDR